MAAIRALDIPRGARRVRCGQSVSDPALPTDTVKEPLAIFIIKATREDFPVVGEPLGNAIADNS